MTDLEHNKRAVVAFFTRAFNDHKPDDAVAKYVGSQYIQHNPDTADGPAAFAESTKKLIAKCPDVSVEIKRVIAEGNLVVTHDLVRLAPGDRALPALTSSVWKMAGLSNTGMPGNPCRRRWRTATPCSDGLFYRPAYRRGRTIRADMAGGRFRKCRIELRITKWLRTADRAGAEIPLEAECSACADVRFEVSFSCVPFV